MKLTVTGMRQLERRLKQLAKEYPQAAAAALYQEGMRLWADAAKRAPVEFGVLRNSAYATPPIDRNGQAVVEVGFGTEYAWVQHQRTDYEHPRGGEAKYLENALNALRSGYVERMIEGIKKNVAAGVKSVTLQAPPRPGGSFRMKSGAARTRRALTKRRKR